METPCVTTMLMGSLTIAFVLADIAVNAPIFSHLFLGIIATALFHFLCKYGQERVNWIFLGILIIYILISIVVSIVIKNFKKVLDDQLNKVSNNNYINEDEYVCVDTIEPAKKRKEKKKNRC